MRGVKNAKVQLVCGNRDLGGELHCGSATNTDHVQACTSQSSFHHTANTDLQHAVVLPQGAWRQRQRGPLHDVLMSLWTPEWRSSCFKLMLEAFCRHRAHAPWQIYMSASAAHDH